MARGLLVRLTVQSVCDVSEQFYWTSLLIVEDGWACQAANRGNLSEQIRRFSRGLCSADQRPILYPQFLHARRKRAADQAWDRSQPRDPEDTNRNLSRSGSKTRGHFLSFSSLSIEAHFFSPFAPYGASLCLFHLLALFTWLILRQQPSPTSPRHSPDRASHVFLYSLVPAEWRAISSPGALTRARSRLLSHRV